MSWHAVVNALADNPLLERLCFATLELLAASLVLALILRRARLSSMRLVACLWLIVLAKPMVTLAIGAPVALLRFSAPVAETASAAPRLDPVAPRFPAQREDALDPAWATVSGSVPLLPEGPRPDATNSGAEARSAFDLRTIRLESLLLAAWAAGVAWFSARYLLVRWRLRRLVRGATTAPRSFGAQYAEIARQLGLARSPALRVTDELDSPAIVGLVRPTVLLPRWLVERGASAQSEWALRHELAHWRWLDPLAILVRDLAAILFFFHPAVSWAARRHSEAMEMACDWESLRDPSEATDYAEGLCGILASIGGRRTAFVNVDGLAMATHGRMARRIAALLDGRRARPLTTRGGVGLALTALLVFSIGCSVSRDEGQGAAPLVADSAQKSASASEHGNGGPTRGLEKSVLDGLRWLLRHQNPDGSWSPATVAERCPCDEPIYKPKTPYHPHYDEGVTGLALLSFLGAGFGDESRQDIVDPATGQRYVVGDAVEKGLLWLVGRQKADGSFSRDRVFMYNEALACLALTEAYSLTRSARWKDAAQKAIEFVQAAQRPSPSGQGLWGWRYASRQEIEKFHRGAGTPNDAMLRELCDSDTSITGWCILALESGRRAGLRVGEDHLAGGLAFAKFVTQEETGLVGYLDRRGAGATVTGPNDHFVYHPATMSALGMSIRMSVEKNFADPVLDRSAQVIAKDVPTITPDQLSIDYYSWFHASRALNQFDGPDSPSKTNAYWGPWSKALVESVLALQDHTERDCRNGGWLVADRWTYQGGPIYTTAINLLTLEGYYRYDNALGRSKPK